MSAKKCRPEWQVTSECVEFNVPLDTTGHFRNESLQANDCIGTGKKTKQNTTNTLNTRETEKAALANKIWTSPMSDCPHTGRAHS